MTDWLMVIITAVYVVATIWICKANIASATASKEQLKAEKEQTKEQKKQYEETKRLSMMPLFQLYESEITDSVNNKGIIMYLCKVSNTSTSSTKVTLKNIGLGTAKNIYYDCEYLKCDYKKNRENFKIPAFQSGDKINIGLGFKTYDTIFITLYFQDLLENEYSQKIEIKFTGRISQIINHSIEKSEE